MTDFSSVTAIRNEILDANLILGTFQTIYQQCKVVQGLLARYQTDPAFKAEADHLFTLAQRAELNQMVTDVNTLITAWEANHKGPLGLDVPTP